MSTLLHATTRPTEAGSAATDNPGLLATVPGLTTTAPQLTSTAPGIDRSAADATEQVANQVRALALDRPPTIDSELATWSALAAVGRDDLTVGRLVEGHVDALRILHEANREPVPAAVYGVWASASGGTGLRATSSADGWSVDGVMRYCSGAWFIDRALVVISAEDGKRLVDLDVRAGLRAGGPLTRQDDTWPAVGMDATRSVDVVVQGLSVGAADLVGGPGFYLDRPGFTAGGVGVAAVWLGGAAGVLDALIRTLTSSSTPSNSSDASAHQRAHLGAMAARIAAADALLAELADRLDRRGPDRAGWQLSADDARAARTAVELAVEEVLRRAPRVSGPTPLCRDAGFGHRLADLEVYVRQHHAELDYEQLGSRLLESGELLGRRFG